MLNSVRNKATMSILARLKDKGMPGPAGSYDDTDEDQEIDDGRTIQNMPKLAGLKDAEEGEEDAEENQDDEPDLDTTSPAPKVRRRPRAGFGLRS